MIKFFKKSRSSVMKRTLILLAIIILFNLQCAPRASSDSNDALLEMVVKDVYIDSRTEAPVVVLKEKNGERTLMLVIGIYEAHAIVRKMKKIITPRPMTHDLLENLIKIFKAKVNRIVITSLKNNTYYATIDVLSGNEHFQIDSRPSDAIALALSMEIPIFTAKEVIEESKKLDLKDLKERGDAI